jgi:hypothetical protein
VLRSPSVEVRWGYHAGWDIAIASGSLNRFWSSVTRLWPASCSEPVTTVALSLASAVDAPASSRMAVLATSLYRASVVIVGAVPADLVPLSTLERDLAAPSVGGWTAYSTAAVSRSFSMTSAVRQSPRSTPGDS